jgi:hypothetical protein
MFSTLSAYDGSAHQPDHRDDADEAEDVQVEDERGAGRGEQGAGDHRPDQARRVELRRVQRDGRGQLLARDQRRHQRLPGGRDRGPGRALGEGERDDHPGRREPEVREDGEHGGEDHHRDLAGEHQLAAVVPVGERTRGEHQQRGGDELAGRQQLDHERRVGLLLHQPGLRHRLHPVADVGDQRSQPDPAKALVPEDGEGAGARGHCTDV